jgi:hypothetical protein
MVAVILPRFPNVVFAPALCYAAKKYSLGGAVSFIKIFICAKRRTFLDNILSHQQAVAEHWDLPNTEIFPV